MSRKLLINPYAEVNWGVVKPRIADLHQHSTESDGRVYPSVLIDQAKDRHRDVFVLTDHDSYRLDRGEYPKHIATADPSHPKYRSDRPYGKFSQIWPLTEFEHDVYRDPNSNRETFVENYTTPQSDYTQLVRQGTTGEFARDSKGVMPNGLLAIEANELTETRAAINHDIISLMNSVDGLPNTMSDHEALQAIKDNNGICYMAHPGLYWQDDKKYEYGELYSVSWYMEILNKFNHVLGLEIYNNVRLTHQKKLWDLVLAQGFNALPIWGFSGTDSHVEIHNGNYLVLFMEDLSEQALKKALTKGNFYFCKGQHLGVELLAPKINRVVANDLNKTITITLDNSEDMVEWYSCGKIVHRGNVLNYATVKGISRYVRAEVVNKKGHRSLTNPFVFSRFVEPKKFIS